MGSYPTTADKSPVASEPTPSSRSSLEEPSSGRSFFSRLNLLPLRSRTRNVADFHIRPSEPHRNYGAGDHVQGAVILTIVKPVRITHLTVALHGYVRVSKGPTLSASEPTINPAEIPTRGARHKVHGGYASLFQDEQVLSSDGRLEPGRYEFNFDLLFPSKGLPSSIDFERGTISYMITATLTRPTSISPTTSCERKIHLVDKVDVGPLTPPHPHTIYLEPISKRSKKRKQSGAEKGSVSPETLDPASDLDSTRANENSTEGSLSIVGEDLERDPPASNPRSPTQGEFPGQSDIRSISGDSATSASTGRSRGDDLNHLTTSPGTGRRRHVVEDRTITATIELLRGGCLAGDMVPVKVSVQHIKRIKSMHGVIVTLYRQGRIDSAPSPQLFQELSKEEARRLEKEQYYPKSKTGLGGLSLSSAGTCSVFRKDLSQAFSPLIIDPATLTASVTTSVRVPEDAFPTIKGVPGEMITFIYKVEVIVDLGGKLANQIQRGKAAGPRIGTQSGPVAVMGNPYENTTATSLASWGTSIIDTDRLRREKGVISVVDEVIVGTLDSSRVRGRSQRRLVPSLTAQRAPEPGWSSGGSNGKPSYEEPLEDEGYPQTRHTHQHDYAPFHSSHPHPPHHQQQQYPLWNPAPPQPEISAPHYVPPPDLPDESNLSEKERIRRAEQRLLPSQPPSQLTTSTATLAGPSSSSQPPLLFPPLANGGTHNSQPSAPALDLASSPISPLVEPSAPTLEDLSTEVATPNSTTEDKQELERRRLLAEASAPPEFPEDYYDDGGGGGGGVVGSSSAAAVPPMAVEAAVPSPRSPAAAAFEPSAPFLIDDDEADYGTHYTYATATAGPPLSSPSTLAHGAGVVGIAAVEPLPRYER